MLVATMLTMVEIVYMVCMQRMCMPFSSNAEGGQSNRRRHDHQRGHVAKNARE